jgi:hypothetical protein
MFPQTENGSNGKQQLPFVCCKQKRKTEVCFPWSANDNQQSTIGVSANVSIYDCWQGNVENHRFFTPPGILRQALP